MLRFEAKVVPVLTESGMRPASQTRKVKVLEELLGGRQV